MSATFVQQQHGREADDVMTQMTPEMETLYPKQEFPILPNFSKQVAIEEEKDGGNGSLSDILRGHTLAPPAPYCVNRL